jgi:hypothetical protein
MRSLALAAVLALLLSAPTYARPPAYLYTSVGSPTHALAYARTVLVFRGTYYERAVQTLPRRPRGLLYQGWHPVYLPISTGTAQ